MKIHHARALPLVTPLTMVLLVFALTACRERLTPEQIPTQADFVALATTLPLTQNAPPPPYDGVVTRFEEVDSGLNELAGGRYIVQLQFDGVFAGSERSADASAGAEIQFDQLSSARRVLVTTEGNLIGQNESEISYEAVQLGPDAFLVRDGLCLTGADNAAQAAAELTAGALIGGATPVQPAGRRETLNDEDVYLFTFDPGALNFPAVRLGDNGSMTINSAEMWISPAHNAVIRYYMDISVENAIVFDISQPVTGSITVRYDAYELGTPVNITVPFGC